MEKKKKTVSTMEKKGKKAIPFLSAGRKSGSQFCKALLIPNRIAPTCPVAPNTFH